MLLGGRNKRMRKRCSDKRARAKTKKKTGAAEKDQREHSGPVADDLMARRAVFNEISGSCFKDCVLRSLCWLCSTLAVRFIAGRVL